jgi:hypothetical protein
MTTKEQELEESSLEESGDSQKDGSEAEETTGSEKNQEVTEKAFTFKLVPLAFISGSMIINMFMALNLAWKFSQV